MMLPYQMPYSYQIGWVCPKCGGVYAPTTPQCFKCCQQPSTSSFPQPTQPPFVAAGTWGGKLPEGDGK